MTCVTLSFLVVAMVQCGSARLLRTIIYPLRNCSSTLSTFHSLLEPLAINTIIDAVEIHGQHQYVS